MTAYGDFIFQAMFAATAATIVSGAVAERIKLGSFMIFATILVAIGYPVVGSWHWGGGWLGTLEGGFYDFAGSSVVHAFGGFAALACVMILGPRAGKYVDGKIKPILGHSMPLATIGVFLLFLGWFGFNGGSVLSANPAGIGLVFTTTALAATAGALASIAASWIFLKKPDLSMALNGILAGLVGITAGADAMGPGAAIIVGAIAGVIVVFSIIFFDKVKIDDPVGAISVHGVVGLLGLLLVPLTNDGATFFGQIIGALTIFVWVFVASLIVWGIIKAVMGIRVSEEEEYEGVDLAECGMDAYPEFTTSSN
jgi:Amt family ammonium transporter